MSRNVENLNLMVPHSAAPVSIPATFKNEVTLYVGTGGDITVVIEGNNVTFKNVPSGTFFPVAVDGIASATASDIIALW